ncbi:hypothetical protein C8F04DRAFT_360882 [Mycena alexandri]|uniref:Uncharacterized protein n=1 Tax=Mycena alexandri TaxID=1745969 RepID=A0AAD6T331_9AGAR|nr:hypothetical protein C8F04DRAFT_360882 [Mycena alexandri]
MEGPLEAEFPMEDSEFNSYGGGIFSGSHHFTVAGGTFKNITKNYISGSDVSPDFRMIPMGGIDLQRQIRTNEVRVDGDSGVVFRQSRGCVRRVYSAKVEGHRADMTIAIYEGDTAEEVLFISSVSNVTILTLSGMAARYCQVHNSPSSSYPAALRGRKFGAHTRRFVPWWCDFYFWTDCCIAQEIRSHFIQPVP